MERGPTNQLSTMTGARAGGAPNPGRGTGNVPFAPGVATGRFGAAVQTASRPRPSIPQPGPMPPAATPPSGGPPAPQGAPPGQAGPMGMTSPINSVTMQPQIYFELMGAIMSALIDASNAPDGAI